VVTSRQKKYTKIVTYYLVKIDELHEIGLKKPKISKSKLQLEEIDGAEFMDASQARKGIMFSQYPILNVLQNNGVI
jgi:predicted NUDIX family NTP pyrophosphohydrolase